MFIIMGCYHGYREEIDTADTKKEAEELLREYKMAFGPDYFVYIK